MKYYVFCLLIFVLTGSTAYAVQGDPVGHIQTLNGHVSILRGNSTLPGSVGTPIYHSDLIRTAKPGAAGIVLTDGTTISLGPNSELSISSYLFDPKEERFSLAVRMVKGTFVYLSGLIGKLSPNAVQLSIPDATISARGTKLLVEVQDN
ncbi:MAG: FecR family protein [Desulfuromonadaceae bacterium]|nr:FecR family protein [Desulfuromonadaceae bacterium]MDD5107056.1 FecR family protein [Desulfuromonadaceae bacterium]